MRWRVILEKKFSSALGQEAEVGVKWNVQRGWRVSQASSTRLLYGTLRAAYMPDAARAGFRVVPS
jgi:hypothetical protein